MLISKKLVPALVKETSPLLKMNCGECRPVAAQDREQNTATFKMESTPSKVQGTLQKKVECI